MWNNKKPLNENPSGKQTAQSGTVVAAISKKPNVSNGSVINSDGKTTQSKDVSNLIGWQIH